MITYVLLIMIYNSSSPSLTSAEFNSLHNCEAAANLAKTKFNGSSSAFFHVCTPK